MFFNQNLKNLRQRFSYTQAELARLVGVSPQAVSRWESGRDEPTLDKIFAIAKIFNISQSELISGIPEAGPAVSSLAGKAPMSAATVACPILEFSDFVSIDRDIFDSAKISALGSMSFPRAIIGDSTAAARRPFCLDIGEHCFDSVGIGARAIVAVNPAEEPARGALCLVSVYGMLTFKFVFKIDGDRLLLRSDRDMILDTTERARAGFVLRGVVQAIVYRKPAPASL